MNDQVRIELYGVARLLRPDGAAVVLERHGAALLSLLALRGPMRRPQMIALLWPDATPEGGQNSLRQRLHRLKRSALRPIVLPGPLLALAPAVQIEPAAAGAVLLQGHDYGDCDALDAWVEGQRAQQRHAYHAALARAADDAEADGRLDAAVAAAQALLAELPDAEHAHRRLMWLYYCRNERAAALDAYARCRAVLQRQLGVEPDAETRALAAMIQRSAPLPPTALAPSRATLRRPPRLVGRCTEWQALAAGWQPGHAVLVSGEAGIGKSRLVDDFTRAAGEPQGTRAFPGEGHVPYSLLARLLGLLLARHQDVVATLPAWALRELAHVLPILGPAPAMPAERVRLQQAAAEALRACHGSGLQALTIEDLHFADAASLDVLLALLPTVPLRWLLSVRSNVQRPQALVDWLAAQPAATLTQIALPPLDAAPLAELLASLGIDEIIGAPWTETLLGQTGGNPLVVLETLAATIRQARAAGTPLSPAALATPPRLRALFAHRLTALPPSALQLARVAALCDAAFSAATAARVLGCHVLALADDWQALEAGQVLRDGALAHDLLRDELLAGIPQPIAQPLHAAIAQALADGGAAPACVAEHWRAAGCSAAAAAAFDTAAQAAVAAARPADALALWDEADRAWQQAADSDAAFRVRTAAALAALQVELPAAAAARAAALLSAATDNAQRLAALIAQARATTLQRSDAAEPAARAAVELAGRCGTSRDRLEAAGIWATAAVGHAQAVESLAHLESSAGLVEQVGELHARGEFHSSAMTALWAAGRGADAAAAAERAGAAYEACGRLDDLATTLGNLGAIHGALGHHEAALDAIERSCRQHEANGAVFGSTYTIALMNLGMVSLVAGRYDQSLNAFGKALEIARAGGVNTICFVLEHHLANVYLRLGHPAKARQCLTAALPDGAALRTVRIRRATLEHRVARGAAPLDVQPLRKLHDEAAELPVFDRFTLRLAIGAALEPRQAVAWCEQTRADAAAAQLMTVVAAATIRMADARRRGGDAVGAAAAAREAIALVADGIRCHDLDHCEFWWLAFQALEPAAPEQAQHALMQGVAWLRRVEPHVPAALKHGWEQRSDGVAPLRAAAHRHRSAGGRADRHGGDPPITLG